ncbi:MAG: histidine phosphatase family protein [Ruminococcaceae bacterium]|nr:histidine phosphatase family protein [Oscillospiraceae bacterium]
MIFYYIRHGDPIYNPDSLTPLGQRQAEALAKRLSVYRLDKIYASTSNRAIETARPTCELLKKEPELLDFANENYAWRDFTYFREDGKGRQWLFQNSRLCELFNSKEIRDLGDNWFSHPEFKDYNYGQALDKVYDNIDSFMASLGYEHIRYSGKYKVKETNDQRIALFAHQGFGMLFLSCLLDIPYPTLCTHFDMCHSGLTVIEFKENGEYTIPKILTLSSDSHLYKEGLPTYYNNYLQF